MTQKYKFKKEGQIMINTETTVLPKSKKLRMFPIDFKHIMQNSLPAMMTYLKPYLAQGTGTYQLEPFGLMNYNQVVPILIDKTENKCIMLSVRYKIDYDGTSDLKTIATTVISRYVKWLKTVYRQEQKGDAQFLKQELHDRRRKLFSPGAYADFIANNLTTVNVEDIDFPYLRQDKNNRILPQTVIYLTQATKIKASTINVILNIIDELALHDAQTQFAVKRIYQIINARDPKVEVFYNRQIYYHELVSHLTNAKLTLPLNAATNTSELAVYTNNKPITFKLTNFSDYAQFLTTFLAVNTWNKKSTRAMVKEQLDVFKQNITADKEFTLDKSNFVKILQPRADKGDLVANEDLVLDYLLKEY